MNGGPARKLLVVVALFEPLTPGTTFSRTAWPEHVTLASNFVIDETNDGLTRAIREICVDVGPLPVRFAGDAMFGPKQDIHVQLVDSDPIFALHERIADRLMGMPVFAAAEPAYWRAGYRPHMTRVPTTTVREGDHRQLPVVAIAEMTGSSATIISTVDLAERRSQ